ncbi:MAG: 2-amino-4-hydroxy-6-hydroxymethyldihydropteridine diphosphokinase [Taibaiella sp.]|nr:2-amino-4-hydroxy-6-hydroxymethyldihydropteridine diphosphokinase [Taibaiella sp.]
MAVVYLSLGSNEGDRQVTIQKALVGIEAACGRIAAQSSIYETAAWGLEEQPNFLNMAVKIETTLTPIALLDALQQIEAELHRQRVVRWGQRTIDIDIILYDSELIEMPRLQVPHPRARLRRFVLVPMAEIAPEMIFPGTNESIAEMLEHCPDNLAVHKIA